MINRMPLASLQVCSAYQRGLKLSVVRKIMKHFDDEAIGIITVGRRKNGTLWIIDGQQRVEAMERLGKTTVQATIIESRGVAHEAILFRWLNGGRKNVSRNELFVSAVAALDKDSLDIVSIVQECGFTLVFSGGSNTGGHAIRQAAALEQVYAAGGGALLANVLRTIHGAWLNELGATRTFIITGVGQFYTTYPEALLDRTQKVLSVMPPTKLYHNVSAAQEAIGGSRDKVMAELLRRKYNSRLKPANQLVGITRTGK